jgi:cell division protein FtsX
MKKPVVFSLVRDQSMFMTAIMSLLSFLSILALGISLSIGTGVVRWNNQWDLFATIQVMDTNKSDTVKKILKNNTDKIKLSKQISNSEMTELMTPWLSSGTGNLKKYLPQMWEVEFKTNSDMEAVQQEISNNARFLTHANALKSSTSAGWKMILISSTMMLLTLSAIGICISYIARNTAMLHKRELEILNQVGASDKFITRQMQIIVAKISAIATLIGLASALPILGLIISTAHSARVGLMATIGLSGLGWTVLLLLPVAIIVFAIYITKRTTLNILKNS